MHFFQAVELENCSIRPTTRYMVVIATQGVQDTEETIVLGTEQAADRYMYACAACFL